MQPVPRCGMTPFYTYADYLFQRWTDGRWGMYPGDFVWLFRDGQPKSPSDRKAGTIDTLTGMWIPGHKVVRIDGEAMASDLAYRMSIQQKNARGAPKRFPR